MNFEDFIKNGQVRQASKDIALVKSLIKNSNSDLKFLKELKVNNYL